MPFQIIRNDITRVQADAIVNTANPRPVCGSGTDAAIYAAAGPRRLLRARKKIGAIAPGEAAVTPAFRLPAKYIIHTVGPAWTDGTRGEYETLASCYRKSLLLAEQLSCRSVAFPLISAGVYGFPKGPALRIAMDEIRAFLADCDMDVTLVVYNRGAFDLSSALVDRVAQFIDDRYVEARRRTAPPPGLSAADMRPAPQRREAMFRDRDKESRKKPQRERTAWEEDTLGSIPSEDSAAPSAPVPSGYSMPSFSVPSRKKSLSDVMEHVGETFQERLLRLIDERELTDTAVYKRANLDRKLFSKIRCNPDYRPRKRTAVALAIALELNLDETVDLLSRAELALSPSSKFDLILQFCIENRIYDTFEINALLFQYDQPLLG